MTEPQPKQRGGARPGAGRKREIFSSRNGGVRTTAFISPAAREQLETLLAERDITLGQFLTDAINHATEEDK